MHDVDWPLEIHHSLQRESIKKIQIFPLCSIRSQFTYHFDYHRVPVRHFGWITEQGKGEQELRYNT